MLFSNILEEILCDTEKSACCCVSEPPFLIQPSSSNLPHPIWKVMWNRDSRRERNAWFSSLNNNHHRRRLPSLGWRKFGGGSRRCWSQLFSREREGQELSQSNFFVGSVRFCQVKNKIRSEFHEKLPAGAAGSNEVRVDKTRNGNGLPVVLLSLRDCFWSSDSFGTDSNRVGSILNVTSCQFSSRKRVESWESNDFYSKSERQHKSNKYDFQTKRSIPFRVNDYNVKQKQVK